MKPQNLSLSLCVLLPFLASTAWPASLTHGPLVGNVTPATVTVFVRTDQATTNGLVRLTSTDPTMTHEMTFTTSGTSDFTAQVPFTGLIPSQPYTVHVLVDGFEQTPTGTFKTFPLAQSLDPFTFVVLTDFVMGPSGTSCAGGGFDECPHLSAATFANADLDHPAFVILGGDFDHRDPSQYTDPDCGTDRACKYPKMWKDLYTCANWGASDLCGHILRKYPLVHAWDDHDYSTNNGDGGYGDKWLAHVRFAR